LKKYLEKKEQNLDLIWKNLKFKFNYDLFVFGLNISTFSKYQAAPLFLTLINLLYNKLDILIENYLVQNHHVLS